MKRRQWVPYFVAVQVLVLLVLWVWMGGVFAVVMTLIFGVGWILGLIPLSPRR